MEPYTMDEVFVKWGEILFREPNVTDQDKILYKRTYEGWKARERNGK